MERKSLDRLSYQDAMFAHFDRPQFPYNVGSVGIYEGHMPFDAYIAHVERRIQRAPRYLQRMAPAPLNLELPAWHEDPAFDIRNHVQRVELPAAAGEEELTRFAGEFFATPLDRNKPLWEIRLVEGLSGGRSAHVAKVHHCLVDGVGGVELLGAIMDLEPDPAPVTEPYRKQPAPLPGRLERLVDAVFDRALAQIDLAEGFALALLDPRQAVADARSMAASIAAALPHFGLAAKRTPWSTRLTSPSRASWQSVSFAEVHELSSALGGTVNDAVLAILAGTLRKYLLLHGHETNGLVVRVLIPVNVRGAEEEHSLGNRVSFMLAGLPLGVEAPVARFQAIHRDVAALKAGDQAGGVEKVLRALGRTPPQLQRLLGAQLRTPNFLADMVCTNVPGPRVPLYCMGHRMIDHYAWVPIGWRMGLGVAVMSYNEGLYFSFTADRSVLPDLDRLAGFLGESFSELRDAAGVSTVERRPASAVAGEAAPPVWVSRNG